MLKPPTWHSSSRALDVGRHHTAGRLGRQAYGAGTGRTAITVTWPTDGGFVRFSAAMQRVFSAGRTAVTSASAVQHHLQPWWMPCAAAGATSNTVDTCIARAARHGKTTLARGTELLRRADSRYWENGRWQTRLGWADPTPMSFPAPTPRRGTGVFIPDLELFPSHYKSRNAWAEQRWKWAWRKAPSAY